MIYIQNQIDMKLIGKLFHFALSVNGKKIVFWRYLNSDYNALSGLWKNLTPFYMGQEYLETVTLYNADDGLVKKNDCYRLEKKLIRVIENDFNILISEVDSIAIYKENQIDWFMCMIFHESMSLLRLLSKEVNEFKKKGIQYSFIPPNNW